MAVTIDVGQMLVNFKESYAALFKMITAGTYVMGIAFGVMAIYSLREYGESKAMMSSQSSIKAPAIYLLIAAVFLYLPTAMDMLMKSTFGDSTTPISYDSMGSGAVISYNVKMVIVYLVQLIGLISFIKGWLILSQSAKQQGQSSMGRALTHIIGGMLAINILGTKNIIWATFGLS